MIKRIIETILEGVAIGLVSALIDTGTAVFFWLCFGLPSYYFNGLPGVILSTMLVCFLGVLLGIALGVLMLLIEIATQKVICLKYFHVWVIVAAVCILGVNNYLVMKHRPYPAPLYTDAHYWFALVCIVGILTSLRKTSSDSRMKEENAHVMPTH